jgi:hypothetical protein
MKNMYPKCSGLSALVLFGIALCLASCSTSTSTPANNNTTTTGCGEGILCATIGGVSYVAEAYNAAGNTTTDKSAGSFASLTNPGTGFAFYFTIYGDKAPLPQQSIEIMMISNSTPTVGTAYSLSNGTVGVQLDYYKFDATDLVFYDWRASANRPGSSGTITLTKLDLAANLVSGTFSFTGVENNPNTTHDNTTVTVTNGSFTDLKITR